MEREILCTGIGGQGVQLGASVLAQAAVREDREVMVVGSYGGTMRGGPSGSTLVVADAPIASPPIVARAWAVLAMHHAFFEPLRAKLRPAAVVVLNASLFDGEVDREGCRVFDIPATEIAAREGSALAAAMVLVGAFASITGVVGLDSLVESMRALVPAYRVQHLDWNERALRAGFGSATQGVAPAWSGEEQAA